MSHPAKGFMLDRYHTLWGFPSDGDGVQAILVLTGYNRGQRRLLTNEPLTLRQKETLSPILVNLQVVCNSRPGFQNLILQCSP